MATTQIEYDETKFAELILYVSSRMSEDTSFGATKLNKVLFFSDFFAYRSFGDPITGAEYMKLKHGPAPRRLLPVQNMLVASGDARLVQREYRGYAQKRLVVLRDPDTDSFNTTELELVDEVIEELRGVTAVGVSYISHQLSLGWQIASIGDEIPYNTVFLSSDRLDDKALAQLREAAIARGVAA